MKKEIENRTPPRWPLRFFRWFCRPEYVEDIEGDLLERFQIQIDKVGLHRARREFIWQVIFLFRPSIIKNIFNSNPIDLIMIRQHLKISIRSLRKNIGQTWINVGGLALGIMAALLIGLWIQDEIRFNKNLPNGDKIAKVMQNQVFGDEIRTWDSQAMQLGPALREEYNYCFDHVVIASWPALRQVDWKDKNLMLTGNFMEPGIVDMLSLQVLEGSSTALSDPSNVLISRSAAESIFGDQEAMGETINIIGMDMQVAGIYQDIHDNNSFTELDFIAPWDRLKVAANYEEITGWGNSWFQIFVQISDGMDMEKVSGLIKDVKLKHIDPEGAERLKPALFLHPMTQWRLYGEFENGINIGGRIEYVWTFSLIGLFILFLACINFMNLMTARSEGRAKEIGIRKTIGSERRQLIGQFLSETVIVVLLAFSLALSFTWLVMPTFNTLTDKELQIPFSSMGFWLGCLTFVSILSLAAGSYPALYLSSFRPVHALKGILSSYGKTVTLRRMLVTIQFIVSVGLIIGTIVILRQIQHAKNRPIGYNQNNLVTIPIKSSEVMPNYDRLRQELLASGHVDAVAASDVPMTATYTTNSGFYWEGKDPGFSEEFYTLRATHGFGDLVEWEIDEGRDFSLEHKTDTLAFILNQTAVDYMGLEEPIGAQIQWGKGEYLNGIFKVIGVVNDMITTSPYDEVRPMIYILHYGRFINYINVKLAGSSSASVAMAAIEDIYKQYDPENIFTYNFLDEAYARKFGSEERLVKIAAYFAFIAIFISSIGLLGISAMVAEKRRKEIGIRKVLGASLNSLWFLLSKEFLILIGLAICIAIPLTYHYMQRWLEGFDYRTQIDGWILASGGAAAILIAMFIASLHTVRAAQANPIQALRSE